MSNPARVPAAVVAAYDWQDCTVEPISGGLINATYLVSRDREPCAVLQRLHPVFAAEVCLDLEAVTEFLANAGLQTPRLIRTSDGRPSVEHDGRPWRAITFVRGDTISKVSHPDQARAAGDLVGHVHSVLTAFDHDYRHVRAGVHDTSAHLARLSAKQATAADADGAALACEILEVAGQLPSLQGLPQRHCHGDLKISNILFEPDGTGAVCLIDLDTFGMQSIAYELGDALRSWCNPAGEDVPAPAVDLDIFSAAIAGYAGRARGLLERSEIDSIVPGLETVAVELAARFCVDVFDDAYFGWDETRFSSRREHNLVRARGQLGLARSIAAAREAAEAIVKTHF